MKDNRVMAKITSRMDDYVRFYDLFKSNGEIIMVFEEDPQELDRTIFETNARIIETPNNKVLVWPEETPELVVKIRYENLPKEHDANRPAFLELVQNSIDREQLPQ